MLRMGLNNVSKNHIMACNSLAPIDQLAPTANPNNGLASDAKSLRESRPSNHDVPVVFPGAPNLSETHMAAQKLGCEICEALLEVENC